MHLKADRPYHINHVFAPERWIASESAVTAGRYDDWTTRAITCRYW